MINDSMDDRIRQMLRETSASPEPPMPELIRCRIDKTIEALYALPEVGETESDSRAPATIPSRSAVRQKKPRRLARLAAAAIPNALSSSVWIAANPQTVESMKPVLTSIFGWIGDDGVKNRKESVGNQELPVLAEVVNNGYILGNWNFKLPIQGSNSTQTLKWDTPVYAENNGHSIEAVRVRRSDTATEWHLRLQIPQTLRKEILAESGGIAYRFSGCERRSR